MSTTGPALVLIVRHGEKLGDPTSDEDKHIDLSIRGSSRAAAIPSLFDSATPAWECAWSAGNQQVTGSYAHITSPPVSPRFPTPNFIFATAPSKHSNRPVETITPLSVVLNLPINAKHANEDFADVASHILTTPKYQNQVVLICWHHGNIQGLAQALGVEKAPTWPGNVFDRVWSIPFTGGTAGAVEDLPQQLLYGDSAR